jgi:SAM-dependent methyltransferase
VAEELEYPAEELARVPDESVDSFAGVANPWTLGPAQRGETVLDLGCGAGTDLLIASQMVGPGGRVVGVDMTPGMPERARASASAERMSLANVELHETLIESLPLADPSVDLVTSNGVIDLVPDKDALFDEIDPRPAPRRAPPARRRRHPPRGLRGRPPAHRPLDRLNRGRSPARRASSRATSSTRSPAPHPRTPAARPRSSEPWAPPPELRSRGESRERTTGLEPATFGLGSPLSEVDIALIASGWISVDRSRPGQICRVGDTVGDTELRA